MKLAAYLHLAQSLRMSGAIKPLHDMYRKSYLSILIVNMEYSFKNLSGRLVLSFKSVVSVTEMGRVYCVVRMNL